MQEQLHQHAKLNLKCQVHIGALDAEKVSLNKDITELYGAKIIECHDSTKTLLPAMAAALRSWQSDPSAMYVVGSCCGPHPYPLMVRTFASIIGRIAKKQMKDLTGRLPSMILQYVVVALIFQRLAIPTIRKKK